MTAVAAILLGYLFGSIPSAYIVARLWGKKDILAQGDSHIGATAAYRTVGRLPFVLVVLGDAAKGVVAILAANSLTDGAPAVLAATAFAAVLGHCWSLFIGFKGGLGAVVTYGTLISLVPMAFAIGSVVAIPLWFITHKSTLSTHVLLIISSTFLLLVERREIVLALLPAALILIPLVKRYQVRRSGVDTGYANDLSNDFKRVR